MLIVVLLTGGIGYALGWLSLKKVQGSILYGWAIHATVNILSPIIVFTFLLPKSEATKFFALLFPEVGLEGKP